MIASGWTIKYKDPPDIDIYAPISLLVAILNVFIIGISRAFDDSHYKYTAYEGVPGFCFVLLRVLLWVWFIYLVKELQKGANENIVKFLYSFVVVVSVYFLIFPVHIVGILQHERGGYSLHIAQPFLHFINELFPC